MAWGSFNNGDGEFVYPWGIALSGTGQVYVTDLGYKVLNKAGWGSAGLIGISFAFGGTLMVLVYTIGPVSGCHINPAVTIAMGIAGRCKWKDAPGHIVAQLVGAVLASVVLMGCCRDSNHSVSIITAWVPTAPPPA